MNEPQMIRMGYGSKLFAPALDDHGVSDYIAAHNVLRAHAKVYRLYDTVYRPEQCGKFNGIILLYISYKVRILFQEQTNFKQQYPISNKDY